MNSEVNFEMNWFLVNFALVFVGVDFVVVVVVVVVVVLAWLCRLFHRQLLILWPST